MCEHNVFCHTSQSLDFGITWFTENDVEDDMLLKLCSGGSQIAEAHPRFLRRQLAEVVAAMLQIAGAEALDDATRQLAAEFLVTLCEARDKAPGMMRKLPTFAEAIFRIMLSFLLDIEVGR